MVSKLARSAMPFALVALLAVPTATFALPDHGRPAVDRSRTAVVEHPSSPWTAFWTSLRNVWAKAGSALDPDGGHGTTSRPAAAGGPTGSDAGSALDPDGGHRP